MAYFEPFVDIHCHMLPGLDDGPASWEESVGMARIASADGIGTVVVTPHQLGGHAGNTPEMIRRRTAELQDLLDRQGIDLRLLPGADVRVEPDLVGKIRADQVLTLADRGRYVLLELPHEIYIPLDGLLRELRFAGLVGILTHPERNQGIRNQPQVIQHLKEQGCLFQITAGSLLGRFGPSAQKFSEWMVKNRLTHIVSTDAHGVKSRLPVLGKAFEQTANWIGSSGAIDLFCRTPALLVQGAEGDAARWNLRRKAG